MNREFSVSFPDEVIEKIGPAKGHVLFDDKDGCTNGCRCGISYYKATAFEGGNAHDDQEGVYILEGHGKACIDGKIIDLYPGVAVMLPPGVVHEMIRDEDCEYVKSLWFHSAN